MTVPSPQSGEQRRGQGLGEGRLLDLRRSRDAADHLSEAPTRPVAVLEAEPRHAVTEPAPEEPTAPAPGRLHRVERLVVPVLLAGCLALVGFLAFVFYFSSFSEARSQAGLERRFARPLGFGTAPVGGRIGNGTPVARLDIPAIGVHQVVVEGSQADNLRNGPGHLAASPLPGQIGNAVLVAHRLAWGGPFERIATLRPGDQIDVTTGQGHFRYRVSGHSDLPASDVKPLQATKDNRLTLLTAANLAASRRIAVTADLVGKPAVTPSGRPDVVTAADSGLSGQGGIALVVLGWVEVLILVSVLSIFVYRRVHGWSAYLITAPVIALLAWFAYANLGRLLPGSL